MYINEAILTFKRRKVGDGRSPRRFQSTADVAKVARGLVDSKVQEELWVLAVGFHGEPRGWGMVARGSFTDMVVNLSVLFAYVLKACAPHFYVVHNHPGGMDKGDELEPGEADLKATERIREGADLLGLHLLNHIIVGDVGYYSIEDKGFVAWDSKED